MPAWSGHLATDAAAVFSVLRQVPLPRRLTGALEAESGLNDAPTIVLVTLISTEGGDTSSSSPGHRLELVVGAAGLPGFGGARLSRGSALPSSGLYPLACCPSRARVRRAAALHVSGFAAV